LDKSKTVRVLIVEDSLNVRMLLKRLLEEDPVIVVIGSASNPYEAAALIAREVPDVITLDLEMPRMNGLTFLKRLMNQHPLPVVVVSSFTEERRELAIEALALGASEIITKPALPAAEEIINFGIRLREAVHAASIQNLLLRRISQRKVLSAVEYSYRPRTDNNKLILIGASTGGTELISSILKSARPDLPPVLVVQHMPGEFTGVFAKRLNTESSLTVKEAEKNELLRNGHVYIANGFYHLVVKKITNDYVCDLNDGELVNRHRPSVDVLFFSAADFAAENVMAILLTGMGTDGARGMLELKRKGAICIAQEEKSCAVYGMPREAVMLDAVTLTGPPSSIIEWMNNFA
jgi:two-component system chemotaxis response regulator CheB